jgi:hypothetical protein
VSASRQIGNTIFAESATVFKSSAIELGQDFAMWSRQFSVCQKNIDAP